MAKYKRYDYSQKLFIPVSLEDQLMSGTLEFAIHTLVETRMDMSVFDENYKNDKTGRSAYDPKVLLKVVLLGYTTTLGEVLAKYEENYRDQTSYKSAKRYFVEEIREYFGNGILLANIRYLDLETFRNHLRQRITKDGRLLAVASVNRITSCLRHIFGKAKEWDMIEENPFEKGRSLILKENNKRFLIRGRDQSPPGRL